MESPLLAVLFIFAGEFSTCSWVKYDPAKFFNAWVLVHLASVDLSMSFNTRGREEFFICILMVSDILWLSYLYFDFYVFPPNLLWSSVYWIASHLIKLELLWIILLKRLISVKVTNEHIFRVCRLYSCIGSKISLCAGLAWPSKGMVWFSIWCLLPQKLTT